MTDLLARARSLEERVKSWRRHIHAHPELGMATEGLVALALDSLGQ